MKRHQQRSTSKIWRRVLVVKPFLALALLLLAGQASFAQTNEEPVFLDGSVSPTSGYVGQMFTFTTHWMDPEGDFVVDVTVRHRLKGTEDWTLTVLDYIPGMDPPEFSIGIPIGSSPGLYEFEFRASDAETPDGPRLHTTEFQGNATFAVQEVTSHCLGTEFEQIHFDSDFMVPTVSVSSSAQTVDERQIITLTATPQVDTANGGSPFFYWCASSGKFTFRQEAPDLSVVDFEAPSVSSNTNLEIELLMGDSIGQVAEATVVLDVLDTGDTDPLDPAPQLQISQPGTLLVDETIFILFTATDEDEEGSDTSTALTSSLYHSIDGTNYTELSADLSGPTGMYSWTPTVPSDLNIIRLVSTDGNSASTTETDPFVVSANLEIFGFTTTSNGSPFANVRIADAAGNQLSDTTGYYKFTGLPEGTYTLSASRPGSLFAPSSVMIVLSAENPSVRVDFRESVITSGAVAIDIKPGSDENPINPNSNGKIPVAILSSLDFDAPSQVVLTSLTFGRTGAEESLHYRGNGDPNCSTNGDHNGDGLSDVKCHFYTQIAGFQAGDTQGFLRGETVDGETFEASDSINTVGGGNDEDADGIDDDTEDAAPNNGDGNNDGLLDSTQLNVTSLPSSDGGYFSLVSSPECTNAAVTTVTAPELPADAGYEAPAGFLSFELQGCNSSDTMLYIHGAADFSTADYRRYGPTSEITAAHWYTLPAEFGTVEIEGSSVSTAAFQLVDGGLGDDDGTVNGVIVDPGGPAIRGIPVLEIPTASKIGLLLLAFLLGTGALLLLRRR